MDADEQPVACTSAGDGTDYLVHFKVAVNIIDKDGDQRAGMALETETGKGNDGQHT
jgi:hypothetical protein